MTPFPAKFGQEKYSIEAISKVVDALTTTTVSFLKTPLQVEQQTLENVSPACVVSVEKLIA